MQPNHEQIVELEAELNRQAERIRILYRALALAVGPVAAIEWIRQAEAE